MIIKQKYRPIYAEDLINVLEMDNIIAPYIKKTVKKELFGVLLLGWIKNRLIRIAKKNKNKIVEIRIEGYTMRSWGIRNKHYIPLTKGASNLLDIL